MQSCQSPRKREAEVAGAHRHHSPSSDVVIDEVGPWRTGTSRSHPLKTDPMLATDLCLSWTKVLNLVTVRGLMKTVV